jgi:hypothetical protein
VLPVKTVQELFAGIIDEVAAWNRAVSPAELGGHVPAERRHPARLASPAHSGLG